MNRRDFLAVLAALGGLPLAGRVAAATPGLRLAASWQAAHGYQVGILAPTDDGRIAVAAALDVPTRAHGLLREPGGTLLGVARRPGDWLVRWNAAGQALAWRWIEPGRAYAGHVLASADGRTLYTTETDRASGDGYVGVRDAATLEKHDEWPTGGRDPHQLSWDATQGGRSLIVANGGVPTYPETGRVKRDLDRMDSSLVRLHGETGERLGQWRLPDARLSLRHLAWGGTRAPLLGIALQAEHDRAEDKATAPILALFDGTTLRSVAADRPLAGYGGDIAASGDRFAVSCPRDRGIALYDAARGWERLLPLDEACALADHAGRILAGGRTQVMQIDAASYDLPDLRLDNHWIVA
ncbi:MAG: DUF1513 domain-containing protein [Pseudomonadota bacterium]